MADPRWDRLIQSLAEAGIEAKLTERDYVQDGPWGQGIRYGVSRSIIIRTPTGAVEISDRWWRKNRDVWIGWDVTREDRQGIVKRQWGPTKKRAEVRSAVLTALEES
jgi:hypothetical protein